VPLLATDLARLAELEAWWRRAHGISDPRVARLAALVRDRFRITRLRFSDAFEASVSVDPRGAHYYRYSYAFPEVSYDRRGALKALARCLQAFDADCVRVAEPALRVAADPKLVDLPLLGVACDGRDRYRLKVYLQFRDDASALALEASERLVGTTSPRPPGATLHMLGLDLGPTGLVGAKWYWCLPRVPTRDAASPLGPVPLFARLAERGVEALRDVLLVYRTAPGLATAERLPDDVDFPLARNELLWRDVAPLLQGPDGLPLADPLAPLEASFRLAARRVSLSVASQDRTTVYYVLAEKDPL